MKRDSIFSGFLWKFAERTCAQLVAFLISLIVARILSARDYGIVAVIQAFIVIAEVFAHGGFGSALIQKKDANNLDFSSVFWFSIVFSLVIYMGIFISAPFIEAFYGSDYAGLSTALRVMALQIPIGSINSVQHSYVSRNMIFKRFFFATLGGTVGSGIVGICMALSGCGYWALIAQYLFNQTVDTIILWITVRWRPNFVYSWQRLKGLLSYGWKVLVSSLIDKIYGRLRTMLIGKIYTSDELAYYNRGNQFPGLIIDNINAAIMGVMFPALSSFQHDYEKVKQLARKAVRISSYIIFPMMLGLAVTARDVVQVTLTEKWLPAVPYLQLFCLIYAFKPITQAVGIIIKAVGRTDIMIKVEIIKKVTGIALLLFVLNKGVMAIAVSYAITSVFGAMLDIQVAGRLVRYTIKEQIMDILPHLMYSLGMGAIIYGINLFIDHSFIRLLADIAVGAGVYLMVSKLTKNESLAFIMEKIKTFRH